MAIVVDIQPLNPATGTRVMLRVAAGDDKRLTGLNDVRWWPGVFDMPEIGIEAWDGDFSGAASLGAARIAVDPLALRKNDPLAPSYRWAGAPMRIYEGDADAVWGSWATLFAGLITDYGVDEDGRYSFTAAVDTEPFEANLLASTYAGTGGAEGGDDLKDKVKPLCIGRARNIEPVLVDAVNNVFQVHGYGPVQAISNVYERAADLVQNGGSNVGDFATYAALVAANIPEGNFGTCTDEGLFRLGAPPAGLITADVDGDNVSGFVRSTSDVIARLCELAGIDSARIDSASLAALEAAVPYPINLYLAEPVKLIDLVQSLARPCNAQAVISRTGVLRIVRFGAIGSPSSTLDAQGREMPPVLGVEEIKTSPPYWRIEMLGNRAWRQHSKEEIAFVDTATGEGLGQFTINADDGLKVSNRAIEKTAGGTGWNRQARSLESFYRGAYCSFTPAQANKEFAVGLSSDPAAGADLATIDFAIHCKADGTLWIEEAGAKVLLADNGDRLTDDAGNVLTDDDVTFSQQFGTYAAGDVLSVRYDNDQISYTKNGTVLRVFVAATSQRFYLDSSFREVGARAENVTFGPVGAVNRPMTQWSVNGTSGWHATFASGDIYARYSYDGGETWTPAQRVIGPDGPPGGSGEPGRDAIVFYQDTTPTSPVVGDTWVTISGKLWRRWDGTSWVQILGDVAALSIINEAYIADLAVGSAKIANLSVTTLKVAGNAISETDEYSSDADVYGNASIWEEILSFDFSMPFDGRVIFLATGYLEFPSGPRNWGLRLSVDGSEIDVVDGGVPESAGSMSKSVALSAGSHTGTIEFSGQDSGVMIHKISVVKILLMR